METICLFNRCVKVHLIVLKDIKNPLLNRIKEVYFVNT